MATIVTIVLFRLTSNTIYLPSLLTLMLDIHWKFSLEQNTAIPLAVVVPWEKIASPPH